MVRQVLGCARLSGVLVVAALGSTAAAVQAGPPVAHEARTVLVSAHCGGLGVQRPKGITLACADNGLYLSRLRWRRWGGRVAVGRGILFENTCVPFCMAMSFISAPVRVHLYRRRDCPGRTHLYYTRGTIIRGDGRRERMVLSCPW